MRVVFLSLSLPFFETSLPRIPIKRAVSEYCGGKGAVEILGHKSIKRTYWYMSKTKNLGPDDQRTDGTDLQRTDGELLTPETQRRVTWADVVKISTNSKFKKEKTSNR